MWSCRLFTFDKCPGVCPIVVGVLRRMIGGVMALATGIDVEDLCGANQLCSGLRAGIEGAVHAVRELCKEHCGNGWRDIKQYTLLSLLYHFILHYR